MLRTRNSDGLVIQVKRGDTVTISFGIGEKWFLDGNADGEVANPSSNKPFKPPSLGSDELIIGKIVCNPTSEKIAEGLAGEAELEFTLPVEDPLEDPSAVPEVPFPKPGRSASRRGRLRVHAVLRAGSTS